MKKNSTVLYSNNPYVLAWTKFDSINLPIIYYFILVFPFVSLFMLNLFQGTLTANSTLVNRAFLSDIPAAGFIGIFLPIIAYLSVECFNRCKGVTEWMLDVEEQHKKSELQNRIDIFNELIGNNFVVVNMLFISLFANYQWVISQLSDDFVTWFSYSSKGFVSLFTGQNEPITWLLVLYFLYCTLFYYVIFSFTYQLILFIGFFSKRIYTLVKIKVFNSDGQGGLLPLGDIVRMNRIVLAILVALLVGLYVNDYMIEGSITLRNHPNRLFLYSYVMIIISFSVNFSNRVKKNIKEQKKLLLKKLCAEKDKSKINYINGVLAIPRRGIAVDDRLNLIISLITSLLSFILVLYNWYITL